MALSAGFLDLVRETFVSFGDIAVRRMFGGAGVYCDGLIFAIADDDAVYLKTDDETRPLFEAAGLAPFSYPSGDGTMTVMSYYAAPDEIYDDHEARARWTGLALDAARRAAAKKKPKSRRPGARRGVK
ncbi:MAG: hypothetical protein Kow00133_13370 [Amphiplicatus sp.]